MGLGVAPYSVAGEIRAVEVRFPSYMDKMSPEEAEICRARFLIRVAALYDNPHGQLGILSEKLGLHPGSLSQLNQISPKLAVKIEAHFGADLFPRSLLRPDIFGPAVA